ncbi:2802_t:CDS:1, partial [Cetraspora pellucida]
MPRYSNNSKHRKQHQHLAKIRKRSSNQEATNNTENISSNQEVTNNPENISSTETFKVFNTNNTSESNGNSTNFESMNLDDSNFRKNLERQNYIDKLIEYTCEIDNELLSIIVTFIVKFTRGLTQQNYVKNKLLTMVLDLDEKDLEPALALLGLMRYTKGKQIGHIYSTYLQKKGKDFIEKNLYHPEIDSNSIKKSMQSLTRQVEVLKNKNRSLYGKISKTKQIQKQYKSKAYRIPAISDKQFKIEVKKRILATKSTYNIRTIQMATQLCQIGRISYKSATECSKKVIEWLIGEEPNKWFSANTL